MTNTYVSELRSVRYWFRISYQPTVLFAIANEKLSKGISIIAPLNILKIYDPIPETKRL